MKEAHTGPSSALAGVFPLLLSAPQDELYLLFYDEQVRHRLSKRVLNSGQEHIRGIVRDADRLFAQIPPARFDFNRAKADVMAETGLWGAFNNPRAAPPPV
jgi:hypothetical protein